MSKSACPLYYPSNEVIAFTAGSAEVAARIHGPVFPCQEIKKGAVTKSTKVLTSFLERSSV